MAALVLAGTIQTQPDGVLIDSLPDVGWRLHPYSKPASWVTDA